MSKPSRSAHSMNGSSQSGHPGRPGVAREVVDLDVADVGGVLRVGRARARDAPALAGRLVQVPRRHRPLQGDVGPPGVQVRSAEVVVGVPGVRRQREDDARARRRADDEERVVPPDLLAHVDLHDDLVVARAPRRVDVQRQGRGPPAPLGGRVARRLVLAGGDRVGAEDHVAPARRSGPPRPAPAGRPTRTGAGRPGSPAATDCGQQYPVTTSRAIARPYPARHHARPAAGRRCYGRTMTDELAYLMDRLEIDDLLTRYATVLDNRRWDDLGTVFTPDATLDYRSAGGIRGSFTEVGEWLSTVLPFFTWTPAPGAQPGGGPRPGSGQRHLARGLLQPQRGRGRRRAVAVRRRRRLPRPARPHACGLADLPTGSRRRCGGTTRCPGSRRCPFPVPERRLRVAAPLTGVERLRTSVECLTSRSWLRNRHPPCLCNQIATNFCGPSCPTVEMCHGERRGGNGRAGARVATQTLTDGPTAEPGADAAPPGDATPTMEDVASLAGAMLKLPDSVVIVDENGNVAWGNSSAQHLFGRSLADGVGISGLTWSTRTTRSSCSARSPPFRKRTSATPLRSASSPSPGGAWSRSSARRCDSPARTSCCSAYAT